eukprot:GHVR01145143.1.p1 GENE.GHVR01145143.1~~GHVR01145143.1.p1  ORF type:complete len:162 (+),score=40.92 GHVR01145143.1:56-541(+)
MGCGASVDRGGVVEDVCMNPKVLQIRKSFKKFTLLPQWTKMAEAGFDQLDTKETGKVKFGSVKAAMRPLHTACLTEIYPEGEHDEIINKVLKDLIDDYDYELHTTLDCSEFVEFSSVYICRAAQYIGEILSEREPPRKLELALNVILTRIKNLHDIPIHHV